TRVRLGATDPPLGIVPLDQYGEASAEWRPSQDLLCLFTDGLSDAFVGGEEALMDEIVSMRDRPLRAIIDRIFRATAKRLTGIPRAARPALLVRRGAAVGRAKNPLAQNSLADRTYQQRIVTALEAQPEDVVLEIGPGTGALTDPLAGTVRRLVAVEKDDALA